MWVASDSELLFTADGSKYESAGALPAGFPVHGVSIVSYEMNHNKSIVRYMLVGYETEAMDGDAVVWSKLSTETTWVKYDNADNVNYSFQTAVKAVDGERYYSMSENQNITTDLENMSGTSLIANGNGYTINGNGYLGLIIEENQNFSINNAIVEKFNTNTKSEVGGFITNEGTIDELSGTFNSTT